MPEPEPEEQKPESRAKILDEDDMDFINISKFFLQVLLNQFRLSVHNLKEQEFLSL